MHTLYSLALRFCCPLRQLRRSSPPPQPLIPPSLPASGTNTPWCVCGMEKEREDEETEGKERPEPLTDVERGIIQDTWARVYETCEDVGVTILISHFSSALQSYTMLPFIAQILSLLLAIFIAPS
ncbi:Cytoglobin-2 [Anabarilius grahami]|uniref:Cytoglobin-2 n=1 Tax=Anabarilius grahami TaxID=495550 RepID=A0A3N0XFQ2_ANAGA|nr:Cytoglobin-2 [Anabarilius grahami]